MPSPILSFSFPHRSIEHPIAWDPCTNLLALTCRDQHVLSIIVLDPQSPEVRGTPRTSTPLTPPQDYAVLPVPDAKPEASVVSLEWSPPGTARTLLALTSLHRVHAWTRPAATPVALNRWQPSPLFTPPPDVVHAQWIAPPQMLQWTPHGSDKGVLQRFSPLGGGPAAAAMSWLRTGMHCIATITSQATLQARQDVDTSTISHHMA